MYLDAGYSVFDIVKLNLWENNSLTEETGFDFDNWLEKQGLYIVKYAMSFLPLNEALRCYLKIKSFKEEFKKDLIKVLFYPVVQLCLAFLLSLVAQYWVLPLLQDLIADMDLIDGSVIFFISLIKIVYITLLVTLFLSIIIFLIIKKAEKSAIYILLNQRYTKTIKDVVIYQFINYYLIFYQATDAIDTVINGLRKLPDSEYINMYADKIHFSLLNGDSLANAFEILDIKLKYLLDIGADTGKTAELLSTYTQSLSVLFEYKVKKIGRNFQVFSYFYILILVILIYQMMLMPLAMIERM